ncbi:Uncharacterised protein [uncultured archaeon]|nr:Uncharacterised protein [uncultured archaeon]
MTRKRGPDPDVEVEDDDEDEGVDAERDDENAEDDEEPEPTPRRPPAPTSPDEDPAFWKQKYYDTERAKSEAVKDMREKMDSLQDKIRSIENNQATAPQQTPTESVGEGRPAQHNSGDRPPYRLRKKVAQFDRNGNTVVLPQEVQGWSSELKPRTSDDVPSRVFLAWGAGEYQVIDGDGRLVNTFTIDAGTTTGPTNVVGAPQTQGATLGQFLVDPVQRALNLFEQAKKTGDEKLMQLAANAIQRELEGGGQKSQGQSNDLANALATITALFGAMNQAKATFQATGLGGSADTPELALKRFDAEQSEKKFKFAKEIAETVMDRGKEYLPEIAKALKKPDLDAKQAQDAAQRLAQQAPPAGGPGFYPTRPSPATPSPMGTPAAPRPSPAPAAPQAPPRQSKAPPPGTLVLCGCGQQMTIEKFLTHADTCPGNAPAAQAPVAPQQVANQGEIPMKELPDELKQYLEQMTTVSSYIVAWADGDTSAAPEAVAGTLYLGLATKPEDRKKLVDVAEQGFDKQMSRPDLKQILEDFGTFPSWSADQINAFVSAAVKAGLMTEKDVQEAKELLDLAPVVDEFKNHIAIQTGPKGREWYCRFLNAIALRAGKTAAHPEFLPGANANNRAGRDNL